MAAFLVSQRICEGARLETQYLHRWGKHWQTVVNAVTYPNPSRPAYVRSPRLPYVHDVSALAHLVRSLVTNSFVPTGCQTSVQLQYNRPQGSVELHLRSKEGLIGLRTLWNRSFAADSVTSMGMEAYLLTRADGGGCTCLARHASCERMVPNHAVESAGHDFFHSVARLAAHALGPGGRRPPGTASGRVAAARTGHGRQHPAADAAVRDDGCAGAAHGPRVDHLHRAGTAA